MSSAAEDTLRVTCFMDIHPHNNPWEVSSLPVTGEVQGLVSNLCKISLGQS